jgi:hypothetical protein
MPISSYSYNSATAVLTPVLTGFPGKIIAIDGRPGSGKTTLGRYLAWYFNVSLLETDLFLKDGQGFNYHLDNLGRMLSKRTERPLPVIIEGVAIRWLLDSIGRQPDFSIYVVNNGPASGNSLLEHVLAYESKYHPDEKSDLVIELSH